MTCYVLSGHVRKRSQLAHTFRSRALIGRASGEYGCDLWPLERPGCVFVCMCFVTGRSKLCPSKRRAPLRYPGPMRATLGS
ncbi:hypothetical protein CROQUDRAFT_488425 [Cronartium quercuum f. sp. fusiforme G11]|uniref:Uncharacterized protein n=1 Tax=Cronartium quercuum f. sp. fusiforme G11 TaxID=708437 RepID=A0A9P6TDT8_9BASI|nr:hypothetical protein CROQUDRAFT_488425 [Cronartium quercuum f. sp. fusiforme G11]